MVVQDGGDIAAAPSAPALRLAKRLRGPPRGELDSGGVVMSFHGLMEGAWSLKGRAGSRAAA